MTAGGDDSGSDPLAELLSSRFTLRRLLATGGMANVYEAHDLVTDRVGALKLLRPDSRKFPDAVERLSREASAATRIVSPHIVQALDAGKLASGEPFVFMELLCGEPLDRLLERRKRLRILEAIEIAAQAASGLCAAHAMNVLHRDIKPANLFLSGPSRGALKHVVKLLDFGVSKLPDRDLLSLTREGFALGTFAYMPPEQMLGAKRVDARADIYSLAVVLYQCIGGRLPFAAKNLRALMASMEKNDYTKVSQLRPDVPRELDAILERGLRADPNERYATAGDLRDDLQALSGKALPQPTLSIGDRIAAQPAEAVPVPVMQIDEAQPMTHAAAVAQGSAWLVETVIPKTHRTD
jgi:serine/threonine protein kinase